MGGSSSKAYHKTNEPSLQGQHFIVTGATSGIGRATLTGLLRRGAHVIAPARNEAKAAVVFAEIKESVKETNPNPEITFVPLDLDDIDSARAAAKAVADLGVKISVLINNAGLGMQGHSVSKDGYERVMTVNHLNVAAWTWKLLELNVFVDSGARIVMLSSDGYSMSDPKLDWDWVKNPTEDRNKGTMGQLKVYAESKWANILFASELAKRWTNGTAYAVHPGVVSTSFTQQENSPTILRLFLSWFGTSPAKGSESSLFTALHPGLEEHNGAFFTDKSVTKQQPLALTAKHTQALEAEGERMWTTTLELTGSTDPFA